MSSMLRTNGWNDFAAGANFFGGAIQFVENNKDKQVDGIAPQDLSKCPRFVKLMKSFDGTDAERFGIRNESNLDAYVCKAVNGMFAILRTNPWAFKAMVQKSNAAISESFDKQAQEQQTHAEMTVKTGQQTQNALFEVVASTSSAGSSLALSETPRANSTLAMIRSEVSNKAASDFESRIIALTDQETPACTETVVERTTVVYKKVFVKDVASKAMLAILFVLMIMHVVLSMDAPANPCNTLFGSAPEGCFPS